MNIQWYPGHMTKAKRAMQTDIKLVDLIIELVDGRAPMASRNPEIDELGKGKGRLILLNKADLASEQANLAWMDFFQKKGFEVMKVDARSRADLKQIHAHIQQTCRERIERHRRRGILNRPIRAMVAGIPNVGKSTFINSLSGRASAKTGNRPGVTKGNQWIRLNKQVELLDTPGILWPRFDDQEAGLRLAFLGSINDEILDLEELASELAARLTSIAPGALKERYGIEEDGAGGYELLCRIAKARACLSKGGEIDCNRASRLFLEEFRSGRLGRITLELPGEYEAAGEKEAVKKEKKAPAGGKASRTGTEPAGEREHTSRSGQEESKTGQEESEKEQKMFREGKEKAGWQEN